MEDSNSQFERLRGFFEKESQRTKWTRHGVRVCATVVFPIVLAVLLRMVLEDDASLWLWGIFVLLTVTQIGFAYLTTIYWKGAPTYYDFEQLERYHKNDVRQLKQGHKKAEKKLQERFARTRDRLSSMLQMQEAMRYASMALGNAEMLAAEDNDPTNDVEQGIDLVLNSCVTFRAEIFRFQAEDLYNFAVYLYNESEDVLRVAWRVCDSRIKPKNREWKPGEGHVGLCYTRKSEIFSNNVPESEELDRDEPDDDEKYVSMVSIPIFRSGDFPNVHSGSSGVNHNANPLGVFVVTSSAPNQFDEELHKSFLLSLSFHLSLVIERVLDRSESASP